MKKQILLLVLILIFGCKTNMKTSSSEPIKKTKQTEIVTLAKGNLYGSGEEGIAQQQLIISNTKDWKALMAKMNAVNQVTQSFSESEIDFTKFSLVAAFDSVKTSGGHSLLLEVETTADKIKIKLLKTAPSAMASSVMTQPFCIIKIAKSDLPIVFE